MSVNTQEKNKKPRSAVLDTVLTAAFAAFIAVCSIISIPVGAVPVTLQTFAVFFAAAMLGAKRGTLSVLVYALLGAVGLPVFSGMTGGFGVIAGPTGGYIIGFIPAAVIVGAAADRYDRRALPLAVSMALGSAVCYAVGTVWFMLLMKRGIGETLLVCVVPFLIPDAVKIALAVLLSNRLSRVVRL